MSRSKSVEQVLTEKDFDTVWDFLERKFGYAKEWRIECYKYVYQRETIYKENPVGDFLFFCQREVNPVLNAALRRTEFHPTFMRMLFWMFRERIVA